MGLFPAAVKLGCCLQGRQITVFVIFENNTAFWSFFVIFENGGQLLGPSADGPHPTDIIFLLLFMNN
jgi:hypothetical protein